MAFKFNRERGHENPPGGKIIKINRRGEDVEGKEEKEGRKEGEEEEKGAKVHDEDRENKYPPNEGGN